MKINNKIKNLISSKILIMEESKIENRNKIEKSELLKDEKLKNIVEHEMLFNASCIHLLKSFLEDDDIKISKYYNTTKQYGEKLVNLSLIYNKKLNLIYKDKFKSFNDFIFIMCPKLLFNEG